MPRIFYRNVKTNPPTVDDFLSRAEQGMRLPRNPEKARYWRGISVFETEEQARQMAIQYPAQGRFIAELVIPDDGRIQYERSGPTEGHTTLWGDAAEMHGCVRSLQPV